MKLSVSTAFFGRCAPDLIHFYGEAGIDAIELASLAPARIDEYDFAGIRRECDKYGVELRSFHLPFNREQNIGHPDAELRARSLEVYKHSIDIAASIGAKICVVHPSSEPNEDEMREALFSYCAENLAVLCEYANKHGIELAMENLPRTCLCNTPDEVIRMLTLIPNLKTCFDMNHFLPWKGIVPDNVGYIYRLKEEVGDRLVTMHASDYDFVDERHMFPLDGQNDWRGIIRALIDTGYNGYFNYEIGVRHGDGEGRTLQEVKENFARLFEGVENG